MEKYEIQVTYQESGTLLLATLNMPDSVTCFGFGKGYCTMNCRYITIEREYGSGGTQIARQMAARKEIACYGREILEEVSRENDISVERIERYEETATNSILYSVYMLSQMAAGNADMLSNEGHIHVAEQSVIRRLAADHPAVFLGHCASEALKEYEGVVTVYIRCTDEAAKRKRIIQEYGIPAASAEQVRHKYDRKRAIYYYANTAQKWDDLRKYDLVLDSGKLGIDRCVDVLGALMEH